MTMAGVAGFLESRNLKRACLLGLLLLVVVGVPGCGGPLRSCVANDETGEDLVPYETKLEPGSKMKFSLYDDSGVVSTVWKTDPPATITQDGVFTAPSKPGRYRVTAEATYSDPNSLGLRAGGWVTVEDIRKSGDDSFSVDETPTAPDPASLELVLDVSNPSVVSNGGSPPSFTLTEARRVREISTYHWNDGKGTAAGGTITLEGPGGKRVLKVTSTGEGQGGVPNAVWIVSMDETLQPGTYTVSDSDPSTWAQNSETGGKGMTWVRAAKR
jgi:hypothetical protein